MHVTAFSSSFPEHNVTLGQGLGKGIKHLDAPNKIEHRQTHTAYKCHLVLVEGSANLEGKVKWMTHNPQPATPGQ